MWWRHPFVILILALWPISRGSAAVAGELEKGSLDLVLSRPISRNKFLTAQVLSALIGIAILAGAMIAGVLIGNRFNFVERPPTLLQVLRPSFNAMAFAFAIFGYTFFLSTIDIVRWRPNLVASTLTLAMFVAGIIAGIPVLENWKWLEKLSIFTVYDPVEAALIANRLAFHIEVLGGIGLAGVVLGYIAFNRRDLPASA
jgi:ABC-2 type transport system permease protein